MKPIAVLFILAAVTPGLSGAPADKYFGRFGMSALRIRYEIAQLGRRYQSHKELPENIVHLATLTEESYYKWAAAYPSDSWLASTGVNLAQLFEMLPGTDARTRALRVLSFVRDHFKNTRYSKQANVLLQRGLPLNPYPLWAIRLRPTPTPSPSPSGSPLPSASRSPQASPAPTTIPSPRPSRT